MDRLTADELIRLLLLATWFIQTAVVFVLLLIARFYQRFSGERTRFRWYLLPIALYGAGAVHTANTLHSGIDGLSAALLGSAGVTLGALSLRLYRQMTIGRGRVRRMFEKPAA
jgi:UDP-N-acetylmuramyl pentapeptide phosphotransferase/UDP-N-acetylglucosamine-1-phosphate transferase